MIYLIVLGPMLIDFAVETVIYYWKQYMKEE